MILQCLELKKYELAAFFKQKNMSSHHLGLRNMSSQYLTLEKSEFAASECKKNTRDGKMNTHTLGNSHHTQI